MAETIGSLVDKICISELKIYHMQEQVDRMDAEPAHRDMCRQRLGILNMQRDDLVAELNSCLQQWISGHWAPKIYRQFKMYNDPKFRMPSSPS